MKLIAPTDGISRLGESRKRTSEVTERASDLGAPEGIRTPNLLIRRHRPMTRPGTIGVPLTVVDEPADLGAHPLAVVELQDLLE